MSQNTTSLPDRVKGSYPASSGDLLEADHIICPSKCMTNQAMKQLAIALCKV